MIESFIMKRKLFFAAMIFLAMSLFAQNGITVQEFSAIATSAEGGELSVKIADVLNKENQRMLVTSCINSSALVTLDLSDCSFEDDEREINFFHIKNVKKCSLPLSTESIEYFDCDELEEIELPDGLEKIQCQAFFDAKKLMYVRIPASVKYVGACAFGDCDSLWYIKISPDANLQNWSVAWNAWNEAQVINEIPSKRKTSPENKNTISFDHENYYLFSDINFEIGLAEVPSKSQKATLEFCDAHNLNTSLGSFEINIKKGQTKYKFNKVSTAEMELEDTDILRDILSECEDYWVKMKCTIVYNDGTKTDLEGSARLYFVPFWL